MLVAKINCVQPITGRLVTQEEKEHVMRQRSQLTQGRTNNTFEESVFFDSKQRTSSGTSSDYGTLLGEETPPEEDEVFSDSRQHSIDFSEIQRLLSSSGCHHNNKECSCLCIGETVRDKAINYYHWFLLLFKNGWWKTTLLLWYLW